MTILPDPMTPEQREAYHEARRLVERFPTRPGLYRLLDRLENYSDEDRLRSIMQAILARRWKQAIEPLEQMRARVLSMDLDARVTLVLQNGRLERMDTEPSPEAKKALAALDEMIAAEGRRFGITPATPHNPA